MRKHKRETITLEIDIELWNIKNRIGQVNSYDIWAGEAAVNGEIVARVGFQDKCQTETEAEKLLRSRIK